MSDLYNIPYPGDYERAVRRLAVAEAEVQLLRVEVERLDPDYTHDRRRWVIVKIDKAMIHLRDAEDFSRFHMPAWPTADRIRAVHEKLTAEVLNGSLNRPTPRELLTALSGGRPVGIVPTSHRKGPRSD